MAGYQHIVVIGNIGREPELKTVGSSQVCNFSVAANETWKDKDGQKQERAEWFNVQAWGTLAQVCGEYLHKGAQVSVAGKMRTRSYDDESGKKRYATDLVAQTVTFLGSGGSKPAGNDGGTASEPYTDDEIPF